GGASLKVEWDVGPGTLTSVSAWRFWDWTPSNDRDFTGLPITLKVNNPSQQEQFTQEVRYAGSLGERIDFVAGVFGFYQTIDTQGIQEQGTAASRWLLAPTSALAGNPAVLNGLVANNDIGFKNTSVAAFGQVSWKVTDAFTIQPGIRINYDKKTGSYDSVVTGTASNGTRQLVTFNGPFSNDPWIVAQRGVLAPQFFEPEFSDWNLSYDLTLSYRIAPDIRSYATYAKTFKTGGINLSGVPNDAAGNPLLAAGSVKPEKVDHFEVGLKTQFWDRRATLNLAGFWTEIRDYQATVNNGQLGVLRGYLANAGKVRVRGIEADFSVRPSERFNAYVSGAYTDHEYVRFVDAPCPPELAGGTTVGAGQTPGAPGVPGALSPANCDISGQWLPGISNWAFSYGFEVNEPVSIFGLDGFAYVGFDGNYRSKFSSNPSRSIYTDVGGYALSNVRLGYRTDEGLNLFLWARNVFDVDYFEQLAANTGGNTGLIAGQPGDPRTFGLTLASSF
ncbi:MAG: TonB-dependent receptor, partial [Blastomonas sp.]|nr:TonB-dependent receptor [Blastomonas sp.]